jgi:hypothetical protein
MTKRTAKIAKIEIAINTGRFGGYKVREITENGAVWMSFPCMTRADADRVAAHSAEKHNAPITRR